MQRRNVESVFVPKLHDFIANERNVEIARATTVGIKRLAVFPALVCNHAAAQCYACTFRQACLELRKKLPKPQRVSIECKPDNSLFNLFVVHAFPLGCPELVSVLLYNVLATP